MKLLSIELDISLDGALKGSFSDNVELKFSSIYLPEGFDPYTFDPDYDLSPMEEEAFRHAAECFKVEAEAKKFISRAEQHSFGLKVKLFKKGYNTAIIKEVISSLEERKLLDNYRYSELWLRSRVSSSSAHSPRKLLVSLLNKGISTKDANNALKEVINFETEYALLEKYIVKNKLSISDTDKLKYKLRFDGFSRDVLNEFFDENA